MQIPNFLIAQVSLPLSLLNHKPNNLPGIPRNLQKKQSRRYNTQRFLDIWVIQSHNAVKLRLEGNQQLVKIGKRYSFLSSASWAFLPE